MRRTLPLLALLVGLLIPTTASAQVRGVESGLNVAGGISVTTKQIDDLAATGAKWARHFLFLDDFNAYDRSEVAALKRIVTHSKTRGIKTMFVVANASHTPPGDPQAWANELAVLAGEFNGANDTIAYEIWNEQDEQLWWNTGPNAGAYVNLLKKSYDAVKSATNNQAIVLMGPVTGNNYEYLDQAYKAGAKGSFDGVGVHTDTACNIDTPYKRLFVDGKENRFTFLGIKEVRNVMVANGDADKGIYVTEMGWEVSSATCGVGAWAGKKKQGVTEAQQAEFMLQGFHCLTQEPYVKAALWFTDNDPGYGLYSHAPAMAAFKAYNTAGDQLTEPCGDDAAPDLEVVFPQPGQLFAYKTKIPVRVKTAGGDTRSISVLARLNDGEGKIASWSNSPTVAGDYSTVAPIDFLKGAPCKDVCSTDWGGFYKPPNGSLKRVAPGGVTLVVSAVDDPGNVATKEIPIKIVPPGKLPAAKAKFHTLKLSGKGRTRKLNVLIGPAVQPALAPVKGALFLEWQNFRRGKWTKIHGGGKAVRNVKDVNIAMTLAQRLKYGGKWRVRAVYAGRTPYGPLKSKWVKFRA